MFEVRLNCTVGLLNLDLDEYEEAHRTIKFLEKNGVECIKTSYTCVIWNIKIPSKLVKLRWPLDP